MLLSESLKFKKNICLISLIKEFLGHTLEAGSRQVEATKIRLKCGNKVYFTNFQ